MNKTIFQILFSILVKEVIIDRIKSELISEKSIVLVKRFIVIITLLIVANELFAQGEKRASFYKDDENQIKEVYHLKDTLDNVLDGEYISFFMNGNMEKKGNYDEGLPEGLWTYYYENGKKKMHGELEAGEPSGYWTYYFENGSKKMEGEMVGDRRDGDWLIYYQNGVVKRRGAFVDGMRKGVWFHYYEDQILKGKVDFYENRGKYTEYYRSGEIRAKGLKFGTKNKGNWIYFFKNGAKQAEGHYTKGEKEGVWNYYYPNQQLSATGKYINQDAVGEWKYYHDNGKLQSSGNFDKGKKQGEWSLFSESGKLKGYGNFDGGSGTYLEYHQNGKIKVKGYMDNGINQGKWLYYYSTGQKEGECGFINGKGDYIGYYQNGVVKIKGKIERDKKVGTWELYDHRGVLSGLYKPYYEKDTPAELLAVGPVIRKNYGVADYKFKSKRFKYFDSKINEFTGLIVSGNPVLTLLGSFPVSIEFYMQERLGHEFEFKLLRNPFYKNDFRVPVDDLFKRGYAVSFKQKFYNPDDQFGLWYFGQGLYYTNVTYFANIEDSSNSSIIFTTTSEEQKLEYGVVLGYRLKVRTSEPGFTIDAHVGMAAGYRNFVESEIRPKAFQFLDKTAFSNTFTAGLNIGYVFAAGKTGRKK